MFPSSLYRIPGGNRSQPPSPCETNKHCFEESGPRAPADPLPVGFEGQAEARPKLGQGCSEVTEMGGAGTAKTQLGGWEGVLGSSRRDYGGRVEGLGGGIWVEILDLYTHSNFTIWLN